MNEVTGEWVTKADNDFYSAVYCCIPEMCPLLTLPVFIVTRVQRNISKLF